MKSSKERNRPKKSGYAVVESIMPSLIASVPSARVEKHQIELRERILGADDEDNAGLPCFWKEELDEICEEKSAQVASSFRIRMIRKALARKDSSQDLMPGIQYPGLPKEDHAPPGGKHDPKVTDDFRKDAFLLESREIQPSSSYLTLSSQTPKEKKQVKFKSPCESKIAHDNDSTSNQIADFPQNVEDEADNFMKTNLKLPISSYFDSNTCSWKKHYDPSEYEESPNVSEKLVGSGEPVDSTIIHWGKKYDPLKFKDMEEPGNNNFTTRWKIINDMTF